MKISSHNKGHRNHPISFLSKEPITGWILYATRNQPTQVLVCGTGSPGELSFTAIPKQLTKDPTFWFRNRSCSHNEAECFLNHDTLTMNLVPNRSVSFCLHRGKIGSVLKTMLSLDLNRHILNQLPIAA